MKRLERIDSPSLKQAREFFKWEVEKFPIYDKEGNVIEGYNQFKSTKGHTLHVGNDTYTPAQPSVAFEKTVEAMNKLGLTFDVQSVGQFDNGTNIFAQFNARNGKGEIGTNGDSRKWDYKGSQFKVGGREYQGFITMAKGNDETTSLIYWLTIVCIVCQNTFRAALREATRGNSVKVKQTKNSPDRVRLVEEEIVALFEQQETVVQTLKRMAKTKISLSDAERAFLGLLKEPGEVLDTQRGKTRLENRLTRYSEAFQKSPGCNGQTVEDWLNAVTYVDTHGNTESKRFDAEKQYLSSEFGAYAARKERAFQFASEPDGWTKLVKTGDEIMAQLLVKPVTIAVQPTVTSGNNAGDELTRLLNK